MAQTGVIATTLPSFPWTVGDPLDAVPLNNIIFEIKGQIANLINQVNILALQVSGGNITFNLTINWGGGTTVTPGPYELIGVAAYDFFIVAADFTVGTNNGSFTFTLLNNGTPVGGLTDVVVTDFLTTHLVATDNTLVKLGDELSILVTSVTGVPINSWVSVTATTTVVQVPILGVTTARASGQCLVSGFGFSATGGESIAVSFGSSTTHAFGMAGFSGVGLAQGLATGHATGVQITLGNITGTATGTSTAHGVGSSFTGFPTLVLDDLVIGVLDQNPLG